MIRCPLRSAEDHYAHVRSWLAQHGVSDSERFSAAELVVLRYWSEAFVPRLHLPTEVAGSLPVFVNHGRWMVLCPCGSAQLASRSDRRFFCVDCGNSTWVKVSWPEDEREIERVLGYRPDPRTRNWDPSQTVEDLRRENREHAP